jgi:Matrixin
LLVAGLGALSVEVADLPGDALGLWRDGRIVLDVTAAGHGWFVDGTPGDDREFDAAGQAKADAAVGRIDLLSVLVHELGHAAGLAHDGDVAAMGETLAAGQRLLLSTATASDGKTWPAAHKAGSGTTMPMAADSPAAVRIDWTLPEPLASTATAAAAVPSQVRAADWQQRFVNHLGATPDKLNPNASLRITVDVSPRLSRL